MTATTTRPALTFSEDGDRVAVAGRLTAWCVHLGYAERPWRAGQTRVIDLSGVEKADSAGLALLACWRRRAGAQDARLRFVNVPHKLREIADLAGLSFLFRE